MSGSTIQFKGVDRLTNLLQRALINHTENEVRKVLRRGAQVIADEAKRNVPVDSGLLRDSIKILPKWRQDPLGMYVGPVVKRRRSKRTGKKGAGTVQKEQPFYAAWVEYGTDPHNLGYKGKFVSGKGGDHPGSKKKPYMRPAYDTKGQEALDIAIVDLIKLIQSKL
jgi:HK97 gp10 family phage protein